MESLAAPQATLPAPAGQRPRVTIHEFRSSVHELTPRAGTDLFKTALVASGRFTVLERSRLAEGVLREKQLNASGQSGGRTATRTLSAADFVLEGTISEASIGNRSARTGLQLGGLQWGGHSQSDGLALTVRLVAVDSGEVVHAVTVRRALKSQGQELQGLGALAQTVAAVKGKVLGPFVPEVQVQRSQRASIDAVLEALVNEAVAQLAAFAPSESRASGLSPESRSAAPGRSTSR